MIEITPGKFSLAIEGDGVIEGLNHKEAAVVQNNVDRGIIIDTPENLALGARATVECMRQTPINIGGSGIEVLTI